MKLFRLENIGQWTLLWRVLIQLQDKWLKCLERTKTSSLVIPCMQSCVSDVLIVWVCHVQVCCNPRTATWSDRYRRRPGNPGNGNQSRRSSCPLRQGWKNRCVIVVLSYSDTCFKLIRALHLQDCSVVLVWVRPSSLWNLLTTLRRLTVATLFSLALVSAPERVTICTTRWWIRELFRWKTNRQR